MVDIESLEHYEEALSLYKSLLDKKVDPLQTILDTQKYFQKIIDVDFTDDLLDKSVHNLVEWLTYHNRHFNTEFNEMLESLAGMSNDNRAALLKKWKKDYAIVNQQTVSSLSEKDRIEIAFELIDMLNFMINMLLPFNLTSKELFIIWFNKNKINFARQNSGY